MSTNVRKTPLPSKIIIVGDAQVGKSAYVKRLLTGEFVKNYVATMGCEVHPITIDDRTFNVWDVAGEEKFRGKLENSYYTKADGAIVMYSATDESSYKSVKSWIKKLHAMGIKNIVVVSNKIDPGAPFFKGALNPSVVSCGKASCIMSSRSMYNYDLPFKLLSTMIGRESLMEYNPLEGIKEMTEAE